MNLNILIANILHSELEVDFGIVTSSSIAKAAKSICKLINDHDPEYFQIDWGCLDDKSNKDHINAVKFIVTERGADANKCAERESLTESFHAQKKLNNEQGVQASVANGMPKEPNPD